MPIMLDYMDISSSRVVQITHVTKTLQLGLVDAGLLPEPVGSLAFGSTHMLGYKPL